MTSFATGVAGYMGDSILKIFSEFLPKLLTNRFNLQVIESKQIDIDKNENEKDDEN